MLWGAFRKQAHDFLVSLHSVDKLSGGTGYGADQSDSLCAAVFEELEKTSIRGVQCTCSSPESWWESNDGNITHLSMWPPSGTIQTRSVLFAYGGDIHVKNKLGKTPLEVAIDNDCVSIVSQLLFWERSQDLCSDGGGRELFSALDSSASVNAHVVFGGDTPLHIAHSFSTLRCFHDDLSVGSRRTRHRRLRSRRRLTQLMRAMTSEQEFPEHAQLICLQE